MNKPKKDTMIRIENVFSAFIVVIILSFLTQGLPEVFGEETCKGIAQQHPGAIIGAVKIVQREVLEPSDGLPSWVPQDLVNRLHINTAEEVIRSELLFKEGERLDPDIIEETRRNIRALDYLRDESMECELMDDGKVQVIVHVKETWTIVPIFNVQQVGGKQSVTAGLMEKNLLGQGKTLSASYRSGLQTENTFIESSTRVSYLDPNILGSRYQMSWTIQELETGEYLTSNLQRPYYSLETPWSAGFTQYHLKNQRYLVLNGLAAGQFMGENDEIDLLYGIALRRSPPVIHRVGAFYQYFHKGVWDLQDLPLSMDPALIPQSYTTSGPGLSYRRLGVNYVREKRIAKFDRQEDFNLANDFSISPGISLEAFGATRDEMTLSASDSQGYAFREGHFLFAQGTMEGRWDGHEWRDTTIQAECDYYLRDTPLDFAPLLHTFHVSLSLAYGVNLTADEILGLGYDTGLRGYTKDAFTGNKLLLVTVEDRIFPSHLILGLVALGGILFWDAGYVWDEDQDIDLGDVRHDLGIGLRICLPTLSGQNILRMDLGFPVGHGASFSDYMFTMLLSNTF